MRKLTFKGFLSQYVKNLSYSDTLDIKRLAKEATTNNLRLRAPLVLYALASSKKDQLIDALPDCSKASEMIRMLHYFECSDLESQLGGSSAPEDYLKVWNSFLVARDAPKRDNDLKAAMRDKILRVQAEKNCSNYRVYTDLKLNPGNINSWLKNGDSTKVSYQTAQRVMEYVLQL
jgi:hypothetical protein